MHGQFIYSIAIHNPHAPFIQDLQICLKLVNLMITSNMKLIPLGRLMKVSKFSLPRDRSIVGRVSSFTKYNEYKNKTRYQNAKRTKPKAPMILTIAHMMKIIIQFLFLVIVAILIAAKVIKCSLPKIFGKDLYYNFTVTIRQVSQFQKSIIFFYPTEE